MKKLINYRPLFFCFVALGLGILLARPIFKLNISAIIFSLSIAVAIIVLAIKYKCKIRLIPIFTAFLIGILCFFTAVNNFSAKRYDLGCLVTGRVMAVNTYESSQNVVLDSVNINGEDCSKNVRVFIYNCDSLNIGNIITFSANLKNTKLFELEEFDSYSYKYNVGYDVNIDIENITLSKNTTLSLAEQIRLNVKKFLDANMSENEANISYASLFGDKSSLDHNIKEDFSASGIAHLLAVSGLHIGFIVAAITKIFNRLSSKIGLKVGILVFILSFYAYLCSFSVSVVRACLMFFVIFLAELTGKKYDKLNSLSIAGIIMLLFKPLYIYDGGFLLSFGSVFCIFTLYYSFKNIFTKIKMSERLIPTLSILLSTQLGLLPILTLYYKEVSLFSIFANLICVPLFEIYFIMLFLFTIICLIIPIFGFIVKIPALIISLIMGIANFFADISWAKIDLSVFNMYFIISTYACVFILSHFVNSKNKCKLIASVCVFLVAILTMNIANYYKIKDSNINIISSNESYVYALELNGKIFCIGDFNNSSVSKMTTYLNNVSHSKCDYVLSFNNMNFSSDYKNVLTCDFTNINNKTLIYNEDNIFDDINIIPIYSQNKFLCCIVKTDKINTLISSSHASIDDLYNYINYYDINTLICNVEDVSMLNLNTVINGSDVYINNQKSTLSGGNWTIDVKHDIIKSIRSLD